jgi:hypothetical protein
VEREGRRAELDAFLTTLNRPEVDSLEPGIIAFLLELCDVTSEISKFGSAQVRGLWAAQGRGEAGDVCTVGGRAGNIDAAGGEAGGVEATVNLPDVL